ncbi:MAG TPA: DUF72 domain-containing protein [Steroidobacteraceae bacterium]|jgi:uncharacterized protein YecE (DUF72 family)|nr:DUF72 domain-containing protein [Steroidobacteraceae bacterium]
MPPPAAIRIGVSGWRYAPWRGNFYPPALPQRAELEYAAQRFSSIEINGSFYSLQSPASWRAWYEATPEDFVFAVKGPRYITHMLRLKNVERPLANFFASGIFKLREKLGPILWQFPANFGFDAERLARFLALLPRDLEAAAALARKRDAFMRGRAALAIDANRAIRHAFEVRHEDFSDPRFARLLRKHNAALVIAETARRWPMLQDVTADFLYLRLHGDKKLYRSGYSDRALGSWAERISVWSKGSEPKDAIKADPQAKPASRARPVYCYFDNTDEKLRAPVDAMALMNKLRLRWQTGRTMDGPEPRH